MRKVKASLNIFAAAAIVAATLLAASTVTAQGIAVNTGSLGIAADGTHASGVMIGLPGLLGDPNDESVGYPNPETGGFGPYYTACDFLSELNPPAGQPFTIEFWAEPWTDAGDYGAGPAPVFNRLGGGGDRSGWVFYQRDSGTGWNFSMYSGQGSTVGISLTGGSSSPYSINHVVAVYDGSTAYLYHNGNLVDSASGLYSANTGGVIFNVGAYSNNALGDNSYRGGMDEVAFYGVALTASQIQAHYGAGSSATPGEYAAQVIIDGALLYWQNLPEGVPTESHSWGHVKSLFY